MDVDLRTYIERILDEREKALEERFRNNMDSIRLAREQMEHRLNGMNEFQKRMDKLEGTFATKNDLSSVERLVYIGVGIVIALQFIIGIVK